MDRDKNGRFVIGHKSIPLTLEGRNKLREAAKVNPWCQNGYKHQLSMEALKKMSDANRGKFMSYETRQKIGKKAKQNWRNCPEFVKNVGTGKYLPKNIHNQKPSS